MVDDVFVDGGQHFWGKVLAVVDTTQGTDVFLEGHLATDGGVVGVDVEEDDTEAEDVAGVRVGEDAGSHGDVMRAKELEDAIDDLGFLGDQKGSEELTKGRLEFHVPEIERAHELLEDLDVKVAALPKVSADDVLVHSWPLSERSFSIWFHQQMSVFHFLTCNGERRKERIRTLRSRPEEVQRG